MPHVVVISTGGTIASRRQGNGYAAQATGAEVLARTGVAAGIRVTVRDLYTVNSARLTTVQQLALVHAVHEELRDPGVDGVVVTHGTDTLEESAFLADLYQRDGRSVVFTGAQRPFDAPGGDGASNLRDALVAAATVRDLGVLVVFDGLVHAARGTVKTHTLASHAFADPCGTPLGRVDGGVVSVTGSLRAHEPLPLPSYGGDPPRVDIVMHHCDADPTLLEAALAAGAQGVVLIGTGAGNATPAFAEAVRRAVESGVVVAVTTRVPAGPLAPLYTAGGAVDLVEAGAFLAGSLRAGQARIAVVAALLSSTDAADRAATARRLLGSTPDLPDPVPVMREKAHEASVPTSNRFRRSTCG
jgi:L-asparaginase